MDVTNMNPREIARIICIVHINRTVYVFTELKQPALDTCSSCQIAAINVCSLSTSASMRSGRQGELIGPSIACVGFVLE